MATHILFYVSAKDCPACKAFATHWDSVHTQLKKALGARLEVELIVYEKRTVSGLDTTKYPLALMRYIHWFPCFVLVQKDVYDEVRNKTRKDLPAVVFNGRVGSTPDALVEAVKGKDRLPINGPTLQAWVEREMAAAPAAPPAVQAAPAPAAPQPLEEDIAVCTRLHVVSRFSKVKGA